MRKWSLFACLSMVSALAANPSDHTVVSGDASVHAKNAHELEVNASHQAIIHWEDFSIGKGEITRFIQPSSKSAVLNRVVGKNLSEIMGRLEANGNVYLVNPNGVVVGKSGIIDAAGFIASTLEITNQSFLSNQDQIFKGGSTSPVINLGTIKAYGGDVLLIGYNVQNAGTIEVPKGLAGLAAGSEVLLKPASEERLYIKVGIDTGDAEVGIENSGAIKALKTELKADGNLYAKAIKHDGMIEATNVETRDGRVFLFAEKGKVETTGSIVSDGGTVHILGDYVGILDGSLIDVSSDYGGGTALIGGDYQGTNPDIYHAKATFVGRDTLLSADARVEGDGGKIIVWGDETVNFWGKHSAYGGLLGGEGGLVEVSAHTNHLYKGCIQIKEETRHAGRLLLDPADITVDFSSTSSPTYPTSGDDYKPGGATATLNINDLQTNLNSNGLTVEIDTTGAGTVTFSGAGTFTWTGNSSLRVIAGTDIILPSGFNLNATNTGFNAGVSLEADNELKLGGNITAAGFGGISLSNGPTILTSDVVLTSLVIFLDTVDDTTAGTNSLTLSSPSADESSVFSSNIGATTPIGAILQTSSDANWTLPETITTENAAITFNGSVKLDNTATISSGATGADITFNGTIEANGGGMLTCLAGTTGDVILDGGVFGIEGLATTAVTTKVGANIFTNSNATVFTSNLEVSDDVEISTGEQAFSVSGTTDSTSGENNSLEISNAGAVTFTGAVGATDALNDLTIEGSTVTFTSTVSTSGAPSGNISVEHTGDFNPGTGITPQGTFTTAGAGTMQVPVGGFSLTSGAITLGSNTSMAGAMSLDAGSSAINLNGTINGAQTLSLETTGSVAIAGEIGGSVAITSLAVGSPVMLGGPGALGVVIPDCDISADVTTGGGDADFTCTALTLSSDVTVTTAGGNVDFAGTVDTKPADPSRSLTIAAGTGTVDFNGAIGATDALNNLTVTGSTVNFDSTVNTTGSTTGNISLTHSGVLTLSGDVTAKGTFTEEAGSTSTTTLGGNITTTNNTITLNRPATLATGVNVTLDSGSGSGNIVLNNTVDDSAAGNSTFTLTAGTGGVTIGSAIGGTTRIGTFDQNGTGAVSVTSGVNTQNANIDFAGPITLAGNTTFDTNTGAGNIVFQSTVDATSAGTETLTLTAGTGTITADGNIGFGTRLGTFTQTGSGDFTIAGFLRTSASTISIAAPIKIKSGGFLVLDSANADITVSSTIDGATAGFESVSIASGTGTLTLDGLVGGSVRTGTFNQSGPMNIKAGIQTSQGNILVTGATTLTGNTVLDTTAGLGFIRFDTTASTINGAFDLTLLAGTGDIELDADIGQSTRLKAFTITSADEVTTQAINCESFTQTAGGTSTTFNGALDTNAIGGIDLTGAVISFESTANTSASGPIAISHTGLLTIKGAMTPDGAFSESGGGAVNLRNNITTTADDITFNGAVTLNTGLVTLTTANGDLFLNNTVDGTVAGANALTLDAGTGSITLGAALGLGTRLGAFNESGATLVSMSGGVYTEDLGITIVGSISLTGATRLDSDSGAGGQITVVSVNGAADFTVDSGGVAILFAGPIGASTPLSSLDVEECGSVRFTQPIGSVGTAGVTGTIEVTSTGEIRFENACDTVHSDGTQTYTTGAAAEFRVNTDVAFISSGDNISFNTGTVTLQTNDDIVVNSNGGDITVDNLRTGSADNATLNATASGGKVTVGSFGTSGSPVGTLSVTGGTFETTDAVFTNLLTLSVDDITLGGNFTVNTPAADPLVFSAPITLSDTASDSVTIDSGTAGLSFGASSTINGTVSGVQDLTATVGAGKGVTFGAAVGGTTPIGALIVLPLSGTGAISTKAISAARVQTTVSGTGGTTFDGAVTTTGSTGVLVSGAAVDIQGAMEAQGTGSIAITNTGLLTTNSSGTLETATGMITQSGGGAVSLGAGLTTAGGAISFTNGVTLTNATPIPVTTGAGAGDITFSGTVQATTQFVEGMSVTGGTGAVLFSSAVGGASLDLGAVTINSATNATFSSTLNSKTFTQTANAGTTTFTGLVNTDGAFNATGTGTMTVTGGLTTTSGGTVTFANVGDLDINGAVLPTGAFMQTGAGTTNLNANVRTTNDNISFAGAVELVTSQTVSTEEGGTGIGDITFSSTLDSITGQNRSLTVTSGTGDMTFTGVVGGTTRLGTLTVSTVKDLTAGNITAQAIVQSEGSGTSTFNGTLNTSTVAGIDVNGTSFAFNDTVTTTGLGLMTVRADGTTTVASTSGFTLDGAFFHTEPLPLMAPMVGGTIFLGADITTTGDNITFDCPVSLTDTVALDTGTGGGQVDFQSTLNGAENLTITAGTGNVLFQDVVGGITSPTLITATGNDIRVSTDITSGIDFKSPTTLLSSLTLTDTGASGLTLRDTVTATGFDTVMSTTTSSICVFGDFDSSGGVGVDGGDLTVTTGGSSTFCSLIDTRGGTGADGGNIVMTSTGVDLTVTDINASGGSGGGTGGDVTLNPNTAFTVGTLGAGTKVPTGRIFLQGTITSTGSPGGDVRISPSGRPDFMSIATVGSKLTGSNLNITAANIEFGVNEAVTILGHVNLTATDTLTTGDLVSRHSLTINTSTLTINLHGTEPILDNNGSLYNSLNTHILANDSVNVTYGTLNTVGTGPAPDIEDLSIFGFTAAELTTKLFFMGNLLNFDVDFPPDPPTPSIDSLQNATRLQSEWLVFMKHWIDELTLTSSDVLVEQEEV